MKAETLMWNLEVKKDDHKIAKGETEDDFQDS
jgi:hypothetical protein